MRHFRNHHLTNGLSIIRAVVVIIVVVLSLPAFARNAKISSDLDGIKADKTIHVIVQYKKAPDKTVFKAAKKHGAEMKRQHGRIRAAMYKIKRNKIEALLASDPNITYISLDRPTMALMDYTAVTVGADIARSYGFDGAGVGVAVIDSGVDDHQDLYDGANSRVVYGESFVEGAANPEDQNGHGTHVAGIVGGNGASSTCPTCTGPITGVAPKVNIINLRVLDKDGSGSDSQTIAAIERAIELKDTYNIRVMNISLGRPVYESYVFDPLCLAVEQAWQAGIVVVASAGNLGRNTVTHGYGSITAPANDPYVITVGAMKSQETSTRSDDTAASYSSKGPSLVDHVVKPDLVAPGNRVVSLLASGSTLSHKFPESVVSPLEYTTNPTAKPAYFRMSGTSMAAPVVAGAAALMVQKDPSLTPDQVKARLMETASKSFPVSTTVVDAASGTTYISDYDIFTIGAGYLDINAALYATDSLPATIGSAISPSVLLDDATGTVSLVNAPGTVFAANASIFGANVVNAEGIVWGTVQSEGIVWGTVGAEGIVWGTVGAEGIVWGTVHTEGIVWGTVGAQSLTALLGE